MGTYVKFEKLKTYIRGRAPISSRKLNFFLWQNIVKDQIRATNSQIHFFGLLIPLYNTVYIQ